MGPPYFFPFCFVSHLPFCQLICSAKGLARSSSSPILSSSWLKGKIFVMCFNDVHSNRLIINTWFSDFFWTQKEKRWFVRGGEILSQTEGSLIIARGNQKAVGHDHCFLFRSGVFPSLPPVRKSLFSFFSTEENTFKRKSNFWRVNWLQGWSCWLRTWFLKFSILGHFSVIRTCLSLHYPCWMVCLHSAKGLLIVPMRADNLSCFSRTHL